MAHTNPPGAEAAELLCQARAAIDGAQGFLREPGMAGMRGAWDPLERATGAVLRLNRLLAQRGAPELLRPALELRSAIRELSRLLESAGGYAGANPPAAASAPGMLVEG